MAWATVAAVATASVAILRSERLLARLQHQAEAAEAAAAAAQHAAAAAGSPQGRRDSPRPSEQQPPPAGVQAEGTGAPPAALPLHPALAASAATAAGTAAAGSAPATVLPTPQLRQPHGQEAQGTAAAVGEPAGKVGSPQAVSASRRSLRYPSFQKPSVRAAAAWAKVSWEMLVAAAATLAIRASLAACRRAGKRHAEAAAC